MGREGLTRFYLSLRPHRQFIFWEEVLMKT